MDVSYFTKEHLRMSAPYEATIKKNYWKYTLLKIDLKTKCYHSFGPCDDSQSFE